MERGVAQIDSLVFEIIDFDHDDGRSLSSRTMLRSSAASRAFTSRIGKESAAGKTNCLSPAVAAADL